MKIIKASLVCSMFLIIISGCSNEAIENLPIYEKTTEMEKLINQSSWEQTDDEQKRIQELFSENRWKYQLLGSRPEYNELQEEISLLKISLEEQNKAEAKRNIAKIQNHLKSVYFH